MSTTTPKNNVSISRILTEDLVLIGPDAREKGRLIELMVQKICAAKALQRPQDLLAKILERERSMSTTLDTGLSIPHARVDGIPEIVGALALLRENIADPVPSGIAIRAALLFFVPNAPEWHARHLQLLRSVAMIFQPDFIDALIAAKAPSEVIDRIRRKEVSP